MNVAGLSQVSRAIVAATFLFALGCSPGLAASPVGVTVKPGGVRTPWADSVRRVLAERMHRVAQDGKSALAWSQRGVASWYGARFHGHRTESGALFDKTALTAAHPTLPIGTRILVRSDDTGRSVVVTVNDRGPFNHRIIDLSRAAAIRIGMLSSGTAHVSLEPLPAGKDAVEVAQAPEDDTSAQAVAALRPKRSGRPRH